MWFANLFLSALILAVGVSAAMLEPMLHLRAVSDSSIEHLGKRQISVGTGTVPSQCTSVCNPVSSEIGLGCPVTACCTPTFETDYYNCLKCVGTTLDATSYATAQSQLNLLYTTCVDIGYTLPQLALPGQPASGSNSSGSATPTTFIATSNVAPATTPTHISGSIPSASRGSLEALMGAAVLLGVAGLW